MTEEGTAGQLSWLLDTLAGRVAHVRQAVLLSRDGLVVATSQNMSREDGDHLSALAAGIQSLARGAGHHFSGGEVRQTIIEMESAFLFVMAAGQAAAWPWSPLRRPTWASWRMRWRCWYAGWAGTWWPGRDFPTTNLPQGERE